MITILISNKYAELIKESKKKIYYSTSANLQGDVIFQNKDTKENLFSAHLMWNEKLDFSKEDCELLYFLEHYIKTNVVLKQHAWDFLSYVKNQKAFGHSWVEYKISGIHEIKK